MKNKETSIISEFIELNNSLRAIKANNASKNSFIKFIGFIKSFFKISNFDVSIRDRFLIDEYSVKDLTDFAALLNTIMNILGRKDLLFPVEGCTWSYSSHKDIETERTLNISAFHIERRDSGFRAIIDFKVSCRDDNSDYISCKIECIDLTKGPFQKSSCKEKIMKSVQIYEDRHISKSLIQDVLIGRLLYNFIDGALEQIILVLKDVYLKSGVK